MLCTLMARTLMTHPRLSGPVSHARRCPTELSGRRRLWVVGCLGILWSTLGHGELARAQQASTPLGPATVGREPTEPARRDTTSRGERAAGDVTPYPDLPEAPADTGRVRHGWHDFRRYDWAGPLTMCGEAVQGAFATVWRHAEGDTASYAARELTPQPAAVGLIAQRCGGSELPAYLQRLTAGDSATLHQGLFPAYNIALALGPAYDADATALLRAVLAHSPATYDGQWGTLLYTFRADTTTHPLRLSLLERDTALFDSLTLAWAREREVHDEGLGKLARTLLWQHWLYLKDTARARVALEAALAAEQRFHEPLEVWDPAWLTLLRLNMLQYGLRDHTVVSFIEHRVAQVRGDTGGTVLLPIQLFDVMQYEKPFVWPQTPYWYSATGTPLSVVHDSAGQPSGPPPLPPGKVTLIWNPPYGKDHAALGTRREAQNLQIVLWLRQLVARYGAQGFQVVILEHTRGSAQGEALPPEQEAAAIRHFYQDMLQLPGLVVVEPVAFKTLPDGRRLDEVTAWEQRYHPMLKTVKYRNPALTYGEASPQGPFLLDRHGKLRLMGFLERMSDFRSGNGEPMFELFIQHLLTES